MSNLKEITTNIIKTRSQISALRSEIDALQEQEGDLTSELAKSAHQRGPEFPFAFSLNGEMWFVDWDEDQLVLHAAPLI